MKLTLKELVNASPSLAALAGMKAKDIGVKAVYNVAKNLRLIQPELETYEKARQSLVDKYSVENKDGSYGIPPTHIFQFTKELESIQCEEFDLDIHTIKLTDDTITKAGVDAATLYLLNWMIELDEPNP